MYHNDKVQNSTGHSEKSKSVGKDQQQTTSNHDRKRTERIPVSRKPGNCELGQTTSKDQKVQTTDEINEESQTEERREEYLSHIKKKRKDKKQRLCNKNPGVPHAPQNFGVKTRISDKLTLEWTTPKETGRSKITGYNIFQKTDDDVDWRKKTKINSFENSYTIPRLKMDKHYIFGVSAENKFGEGEAAEVESLAVLHKKPAIKKSDVSADSKLAIGEASLQKLPAIKKSDVSAKNKIGAGEASEVGCPASLPSLPAIKKCDVSDENKIGAGEVSKVQFSDVLQKKPELNILIVGKLGCGKSATGNTICGKQEFKSQFSCASTTTDCQYVPCLQASVKRYISVTDTPTLFEIKYEEVNLHPNITELFHQAPDKSFHVILLVISAGRFTNEDDKTVSLFMENFGEVADMCTIIVFSHQDKIGTSIEEFLQPVPDVLDFYLKRFGRRYIGFDNKSKDPIQVERLFTVVDKMMLLKEYKEYTSKHFKEAQNKMNSKLADKEEVCELDEETKAQLRNEEKKKIEKKLLEEKQHNTKLEQKLNSSDRHSKVQSEYERDYQQHAISVQKLIVAAIDLGTSYSGYAFSFNHEFIRDPLNICTNQPLVRFNLSTSKITTSLLLDSNRDLVSVGYDADDTYSDILMDENASDYFYFHGFKTVLLNNKNIDAQMEVKDVKGKSVLAKEVFGSFIKALKTHLTDDLKRRGLCIKTQEIQWVLTVPAIWSDAAKQLMRESAVWAGIPGDCLKLALEPEAAAIFYQYRGTGNQNNDELKNRIVESGSRYMVVDIGGGIVDITVHEKTKQGQLKELCRAAGNDCGGNAMNESCLQMFKNIFGDTIMQLLKENHLNEYLELVRQFESTKRTVTNTKKVNITIPRTYLSELCTAENLEDLKPLVLSSPYAEYICLAGDKMRIDSSFFWSLFRPITEKIISLIKDILSRKEVSRVSTLLLVGGSSNYHFIRDAICQDITKPCIIVPEEADLSILKGSVLFGHKQDYICSRVMQFSYGVGEILDPENLDKKQPIASPKPNKCRNIFSKIIERDQVVETGQKFPTRHSIVDAEQKELKLKLYASTKKSPTYTDEENCSFIGTVTIQLLSPNGGEREIMLEYVFGDTEIGVTAFDVPTHTQLCSSFDLI